MAPRIDSAETLACRHPARAVLNLALVALTVLALATCLAVALHRRTAHREIRTLATFPSKNPNPVLRVAADGALLYANPAAGWFLEHLAAPGAEMAPEEWRPEIRAALAGGEQRHLEAEIGGRSYQLAITPVPGSDFAYLYVQDITERKRQEEVLRKSQRMLSDAQRLAHIGSWHWDLISDEVAWSDEIFRILGLSRGELGSAYESFMGRVHPEDRQAVSEAVRRATDEGAPFSLEHRIVRPDGTERIVQERGEVFRDQKGTALSMVGTVHDITGSTLAEEELQIAARVFENSIEGIVVTDPNGVITKVNPAFTTITGYAADEAIGRRPNILKSDRHDRAFYERMWGALLERGEWRGEIWNRRKDGEAYPEWLTITAIRDSTGRTTHYASVFYDITERKRTQEEIEYRAFHDALTGLPNRHLFHDRLTVALATADRQGHSLAVLFLDLDDFKKVNDSLGHAVGDELLQMVARRLFTQLRDTDTVARIGGDEFLILLADGRQVASIAERLRRAIAEPFRVGNSELFVHASIGISVFPDDGGDPATLVESADLAMYRAKEKGKNRLELFTES